MTLESSLFNTMLEMFLKAIVVLEEGIGSRKGDCCNGKLLQPTPLREALKKNGLNTGIG